MTLQTQILSPEQLARLAFYQNGSEECGFDSAVTSLSGSAITTCAKLFYSDHRLSVRPFLLSEERQATLTDAMAAARKKNRPLRNGDLETKPGEQRGRRSDLAGVSN